MRCRIHRGCHEIGGNCVEVEADGKRLVLDIGLPLNDSDKVELPSISGLTEEDPNLLGVFVSHPHPDHFGLLEQVTSNVPVFIGEPSQRIIEVSAFFTLLPSLGGVNAQPMSDRSPVELGPFTVTPFRIDHSAFDSYCLLLEANCKRLLYSGDIRGHGRRSALFENFITDPPQDVDTLICEGTQVGRVPEHRYPTEQSVEDEMAKLFTDAKGMCLVWCSSQNVDRVVSVANACRRSGRTLILDMYTAEVLRAADEPDAPSPSNEYVKIFLPGSQKSKIVREKRFDIPKPYYPHRIYLEDLAEAASTSVMIFRPSMIRELAHANCLRSATLVTSLWSGYIRRSNDQLRRLDEFDVLRHHVHTSGHATAEELQRFVDAIPAKRIVPIHLEDSDGFARLSERVTTKSDNEWWEV